MRRFCRYQTAVRWRRAVTSAPEVTFCHIRHKLSASGGFEQLHCVTGRIEHERLSSAPADYDVPAEFDAALTQFPDDGVQVIDLELKSVPAAGFWTCAGHDLTGATSAARRVQ
jgi:hypothetical protein